jgi:hypothetical protein
MRHQGYENRKHLHLRLVIEEEGSAISRKSLKVMARALGPDRLGDVDKEIRRIYRTEKPELDDDAVVLACRYGVRGWVANLAIARCKVKAERLPGDLKKQEIGTGSLGECTCQELRKAGIRKIGHFILRTEAELVGGGILSKEADVKGSLLMLGIRTIDNPPGNW